MPCIGSRFLSSYVGHSGHGGATQWWHHHYYMGGFTSHVSRGDFGDKAHISEGMVM